MLHASRRPLRRSSPRRTRLLVTAMMIVLAALSILVSLAIGARSIPADHVIAALTGASDDADALVITAQRTPRTLLGIGVGAALGMAGALMQGHTRNPLADPGLFGVNAGSSFAVALLTFTFSVRSPTAQVAAALIGAGVVSALVFVIARGGRRGSQMVLVAVIGTTIGAMLSAITSALILLDRATLDVLRSWDVGAINNRNLDLAGIVIPVIVVGMVLALVNGVGIDALALGDDVASSLGHNVPAIRATGIVAIAMLAGPATALAGPIALLGLVAPHAVRPLVGHTYTWIVPLSALSGIALLLVADTVGRVAARPGELQAGLVVALVGAPLLLAVARRRRVVSL